jgi:hypothetical protein
LTSTKDTYQTTLKNNTFDKNNNNNLINANKNNNSRPECNSIINNKHIKSIEINEKFVINNINNNHNISEITTNANATQEKSIITAPSERIYIGKYSGGQKNGKGKLLLPNESEYEGNFKNNEFDGYGVFKSKYPDANNHSIDACRYAIEDETKSNTMTFGKISII